MSKSALPIASLETEPNAAPDKILQALLALQQSGGSYLSRLAVHKGPRIVLVNLSDIHHISIQDKLVFVFTERDRFLINKTISELGALLHNNEFLQISRTCVVNLRHLAEIIPWFSGTYKLKMVSGTELHLSRERVSQLKEAVGILKHN